MRCAVTVLFLVVAACSNPPDAQHRPKRQLLKTVAETKPDGERSGAELPPRVMRRYKPLAPPEESVSPAVVALGRMLYFEPRLSATGEVSCNSCHPLDAYGTTSEKTSIGINGQRGRRNAPSTYNAAKHFRQFWDGRAATIEEQAGGPLVNPLEMGMENGENVVITLKQIRGYAPVFAAAFPDQADPITWDNVKTAIGVFERGLITPGRWDRFLRGDATALTSIEKEGARLFANLGCVVCHAGELAGGSMYEKLGAVKPWPNRDDRGRAEITGDKGDEMMFKVPSLRNVAHTGPYFHDGSAATLDEAVSMMARHQIGEELPDDEVHAIVAWLGALSGELPSQYIQKPALPEAK